MRALLISITVVLWIVISFAFSFNSAKAEPSLTLDLTSGRVLEQQQAFDPWHPASLTKLMTAYTVFRAIEAGRVTLETPLVVSRNARSQPPSRMAYPPGTAYTVENGLKMLIVKSANDVSVTLAEGIGGSVEGFSAMMNAEANRLGMTGSNFVNPHGLHDDRQVVTARDMGLLLIALHRDFPQYAPWFAAPSIIAPQQTAEGKTVQRVSFSYNLLLERFAGADGYKTGFVCASGYNFAGAATRGGRRIAAIVFGRDGQVSRAVDAAKRLTEGFQQPLDAGTPITALAPTGTPPTRPADLRQQMCSEAARAARYEPGAGQAVVESQWLTPRKVVRASLKVALLPPRAVPLNLVRVAVPTFRPAATPASVPSSTPTSQPGSVEDLLRRNTGTLPPPPPAQAPEIRPTQ